MSGVATHEGAAAARAAVVGAAVVAGHRAGYMAPAELTLTFVSMHVKRALPPIYKVIRAVRPLNVSYGMPVILLLFNDICAINGVSAKRVAGTVVSLFPTICVSHSTGFPLNSVAGSAATLVSVM